MVRSNLSSIEAEQAVLGGLMLANKRIIEVQEKLKASDFSMPDNKQIYETMEALALKKIPFDSITMSEHVADKDWFIQCGGEGYLVDLIGMTPSSSNLLHYASIVVDRAQRRLLAKASKAIQELSADTSASAEEQIGRAQTEILNLAKGSTDEIDEGNDIGKACIAYQDLAETGLTTVFIDEETFYMQSGLYVIAAGTGQGKTTLALNIAAANCEKKHVLFQSMEMPTDQLANRIVSNWGGIPFKYIRSRAIFNGSEDMQLHASSYSRNLVRLSKSNLMIASDTPHYQKLCARARNLALRGKLDLLIVDYVQLLGFDGDNRSEAIGQATRALKALSLELDIPVIILSQLSRAHENRTNPRPRNADLKESGSIEQDADVILFLYDEGYYGDERQSSGVVELYSGKNRHGESFSTGLSSANLQYYRLEKLGYDLNNGGGKVKW
jgi:replicative DNA helicase